MLDHTIIRPDDRFYKRATRREASTWGRNISLEQRARKPRNHPIVQQFYSRIISGEEDETDWIWWFTRSNRKFDHALSLGSGFGVTEERMLRAGLFSRLDVVDLSRDAINHFQHRIRSQGIDADIRPKVGDLNFIHLPEKRYDFVLAHTSLHHIINLEHLLEQVRRSLRPGGIFLVYDFIGASGWQWSPLTLKEVNLAVDLSIPRYPKLTFHHVKKPDRKRVIQHSPFESVRSAEIVELLHAGFKPLREVFTDRLLHVLLHYGVELNPWDDPVLNSWLKEMTEWEEGLHSGSEVPPCTLWAIYQAGDKPIPKPEPWSKKEIIERIGVKFWNPRGIALSLLDSVPCHDRIIQYWMRLKRRRQWY